MVCALLTLLLSGSPVSAQQACPTQILNNWGACEKNGVVIKKDTQYNLASLKIEPEEKTTDLKYTNFGFLRYATSALTAHSTHSVQTEYSFASLWRVGTGDLNSTTCPDFELIKPSGFNAVFPYLNGTPQSDGSISWNNLALIPVVNGGVYCTVSFNNTNQFKFKITSVGVNSITINIRWLRGTGLKTYRCADGYCNSSARSYCVGCKTSDAPFIAEDLAIRTGVKKCVDSLLNPLKANVALNRTTVRIIYPDSLVTSVNGSEAHGHAGQAYGFEGIVSAGQSRVTSVANIRVSLHELFHQENQIHIGKMPSWLDEGFSIAFGTKLNCHARQLRDTYAVPGYLNVRNGQGQITASQSGPGHTRGSHFFEGLEVEFGCTNSCRGKIWRRLSERLSDKTVKVTVTEVKNAVIYETGRDPSSILTLLGITDSTN